MQGEKAREVEAIPRPVLAFARVCLAVSAALFASYALHALVLHKNRLLAAAMAAVAVAVAACLRLAPPVRVKVALSVGSILFALHAFEVAIAWRRPAPATAAARAGRAWDSRPLADVMRDLRAAGKDAWPSARPRQLYKQRRRGLAIEGREELPLGGIAGVTTVLCNESGTWAVYEADEHGFNNPRGIWSQPIEIALVGDSFTQGACVPAGSDIGGRIRARHAGTLNLGMLGNGPLLELAAVAELLTVAKPKRVLWLYFHNDMTDLNLEKTSRLLRRYVDEEGFRVGLAAHQASVDAVLKKVMTELEGDAAWWPRKLARVGLTRSTSPVWLQDLVMSERNSSVSLVLRLEHVFQIASGASDPEAPSAQNPPDFALFQRVLERARGIVASWGGSLTFVYLPDLWPPGDEGKLDYHNRRGVLEAAEKAGLGIIDVHKAWKARSDVPKLIYFAGAHCNEAGYAAIADVILGELR